MPAPPGCAAPSRERLLTTLKAGDVHSFLAAAEPYLREAPDDQEVLEPAVKLYAALGLAGAARQLLAGGGPGDELCERLRAQIPGRDRRIPWSKLEKSSSRMRSW